MELKQTEIQTVTELSGTELKISPKETGPKLNSQCPSDFYAPSWNLLYTAKKVKLRTSEEN